MRVPRVVRYAINAIQVFLYYPVDKSIHHMETGLFRYGQDIIGVDSGMLPKVTNPSISRLSDK